MSCTLLFVVLAGFGGISAIRQLKGRLRDQLLAAVRAVERIWESAGMRYKIKCMVGFYQCVAAVPSVFNVVPPFGLE
eukprot:2685730-Prymnesium_polylepis.1